MKTFLLVALAVVALMVIGGVVYAKKSGLCDGPEGRAAWITERVANKLNLDDNQRSNLTALRDTLMNKRQEFKQARQESRQALVDLLSRPNLDQAALQNLFDTRRDQVSSHSGEVIAAIAVFTDSLSDEQRAQIVEWADHPRRCHFGPGRWSKSF